MKKISEQVIKKYNQNAPKLSLDTYSHFCLRMWRLKGEEKYIFPVFLSFQKRIFMLTKYFWEMEKGTPLLELSWRFKKDFYLLNRVGKKKIEFYISAPHLLFLNVITHFLFNLKSFNLEGELKDYYQIGKNFLLSLNLEKILFDSNWIKKDPSELINTVFYLKFIGVIDLTDQLKEKIFNYWLKGKGNKNFKRKIYALTHLIIADSNYYQNFVSFSKVKEILNFFRKNIDEILIKTNPDVAGEVGLCFRLTQKEDLIIFRKIEDFIFSFYNNKEGYIPYRSELKTDDLEKAEHRNIIAILFLNLRNKLYKGPDLRNFLKKNNLKLYFLDFKKGKWISI
ncbi:MAG: DUF3541 domain-containing protein [Microgenomates group bacterium]